MSTQKSEEIALKTPLPTKQPPEYFGIMPAQSGAPVGGSVKGSVKVSLDVQVEKGTSPFGTLDNSKLFDFNEFRSPIAGYLSKIIDTPGDKFRATIQEIDGKEELMVEYEMLWLQVQLFWDLMLRMQPNRITDNRQLVGQAIDLMLDVSVGKLLVEFREDYQPQKIRWCIVELRRRLARLELFLRIDLNTCGKPAKLLTGCLVGLKRPKYKHKLWTSMFGAFHEHSQRREDHILRIRDIAGLLRLEDFLTVLSRELDQQCNMTDTQEHLAVVAVGFMETRIKNMLPTKNCKTTKELRESWMYMLASRPFRDAMRDEVRNLVSDALAFRKNNSYSLHRELCELWSPIKGFMAKTMSNLSPDVKKEEPKSKRKSSFWGKKEYLD